MGYPVAGAGCGPAYGGMNAAAFVLVLFILLVIILKSFY
ncbi:sporulation protein YjcZ [Cohnella faecalis]|uniref:Sporulation protein YjcZ n=1 Tax=Cohnella faecalis TaxID=2315694 RepID=A0A398CM93_9BACL|nr:sporulation protein YjcZ [Cohnella faecalis]RIE00761.1 sporulation protein YjcZ [Cohnella faecalis]